jgi:acyl-CoA thioester hydrolase
MQGLREIWRGGVNTWECDEMGHMNVRFYVERMMEGLMAFAPVIGLGRAFRAGAAATVVPVEQHIKFLKEAHAGAPLFMTGAVVEVGESEATLVQILHHSADGAPAATFLTRIAHVEAKSGAPFAWSGATRTALAGAMAHVPEVATPRSLAFGAAPAPATHEAACAQGLTPIALLPVRADQCDPLGRLAPAWFIARVSDGVPNMLRGWREEVGAAAAGGARIGAAVLEYRLLYRAWPRAGDVLDIRSGVMWVKEKTHALAHWITDPVSGAPWCTCEAVAITLDLDARKAVAAPPAQQAALAARAIAGLSA